MTPEIHHGYPVTSNNHEFAQFTLEAARDAIGQERVQPLPNPVMAVEDFSYVLNEVP